MRVEPKHHVAHADNPQHRDRALFDAVNQHALDGVDIVDHARHQVARGALVVILDRQPLEFVVQVPPQIENHPLLEAVVELEAQHVEQVAQEK